MNSYDIDDRFERDEYEGEIGRRLMGCYEPRAIRPGTPDNVAMAKYSNKKQQSDRYENFIHQVWAPLLEDHQQWDS